MGISGGGNACSHMRGGEIVRRKMQHFFGAQVLSVR
jgi:hypothetical protein